MFPTRLWHNFLLIMLSALLGVSTVAQAQDAEAITMPEQLEELGGELCEGSESFTCVTLTVPLDHTNPDDERTLDVVFAVRPADGESKGLFVTATGGPGTSGIAVADSYTSLFDAGITDSFDVVFYDQRGAYLSGNLQCPSSVAVFYGTEWRADTPEDENDLIDTARTFAEDCVDEMGVEEDTLPFYGTAQAIEDLELFRKAIGSPQMWLYGESYGTQYAQTYAAAYPENLDGLLLDGTVDLTLNITEYYREQAGAFENTLLASLESCGADPTCADDVPESDLRAFASDLWAELGSSPIQFNFPTASGAYPTFMTLVDLQTIAASNMYSPGDRMMLIRALVAASRGSLIPLQRLIHNYNGFDPEVPVADATPEVDPSYSDALFYAVECNDYDVPGDTAEARAEYYLNEGDEIDRSLEFFGSIYYGDLPCVFWPGNPPEERPAPLVAENIPTLVLGATADPATPVANGERVFTRLDDGYLITMQGGPHVIFGRGDSCPDDIVTAFLVEGTMPTARETTCEGVISEAYVPYAEADARAYRNPLDALQAIDTEIQYLPEYYYWDYETLTSVTCSFGGLLTFAPAYGSDDEQFRFTACAFSDGFVVTGSGTYIAEEGAFEMQLRVTGLADGTLFYDRQADGTITVTGDYDGEFIDLNNVDDPTTDA
jgi:pimeloyl-ACP methyl ester carboxylesterase